MSKVEQVRIIFGAHIWLSVLESDAQIDLDRLTELDRKRAVQNATRTLTGGGLCAECRLSVMGAWGYRSHFVYHPQVA